MGVKANLGGFRAALFGAVIGGLLVLGLPAIAAQVGDAFKLGQNNTVAAQTTLNGSVSSQNLRVINQHPDGEALRLFVQPGNAPLSVNSKTKVRQLHADLLDGRNANQLIRAAFDSTDSATDQNGPAVTATITAPKPGILIMGGSIEAQGSGDVYKCRLQVNGASVTGTTRTSRVSYSGAGHTFNDEENCSTDGGQVVTAAGTYTVALDIVLFDSDFSGASVWVIWVPFDGSGAIPTP